MPAQPGEVTMSWAGKAVLVGLGALLAKAVSDPEVQAKIRELKGDLRTKVKKGAEWIVAEITKAEQTEAREARKQRANAPTQPAGGKPSNGRGKRKSAGATA